MALSLLGCGGGDGATQARSGSGTEAEANSDSATEASREEKATKPKVRVPPGPPPTELVEKDLETGSGPAAKPGDKVTVHYVLVDFKNGKEVEASWDRGEPFRFELGAGEVISGWEVGIEGMKEGGRRQLVVPSEMAYGEGALVFMVDLLSIGLTPQEEREEEENAKPEIEVPDEPPPKDVVVNDLEEGSGKEAKKGDQLFVKYVGVSYKTGKEFESAWNEPRAWTLGPEVIKGWRQGLTGLREGGRRELIIPSKLAFEQGPVIYVVELVNIR